jgi:hypothetical protein
VTLPLEARHFAPSRTAVMTSGKRLRSPIAKVRIGLYGGDGIRLGLETAIPSKQTGSADRVAARPISSLLNSCQRK